jgi:exosortase C (VPDSG-CTERM-specific)
MNDVDPAVGAAGGRSLRVRPTERGFPVWFTAALAVLLLVFSKPLYHLFRFALNEELYSHIILVPFIAGGLIALDRKKLPLFSTPDISTATIAVIAGSALIVWHWQTQLSGAVPWDADQLALTTLAFVFLVVAISAFFLGRPVTKAVAFPLGFLVFMAPLPALAADMVEVFLQHGSALVALGLFRAAGTPLFQHGLVFELPGIAIEVAPECSGIHSTVALLMTSLVSGHLFLRSRSKRVLLCLAVIPLALVRNGFRIFTIGELCVHVSPSMIDSPIHHKGGPIFFALSLIPFFVLLWYLMKKDRGSHPGPTPAQNA